MNEQIEEILRNPAVVKTAEGEYSDEAPVKWAWFAHGFDTGMQPFYSIDQVRAAVRSVGVTQRVYELQAENEKLRAAIKAVTCESHAATKGIIALHILETEFAVGATGEKAGEGVNLSDEQILACNNTAPDDQEFSPCITAPDEDLIAFARQVLLAASHLSLKGGGEEAQPEVPRG